MNHETMIRKSGALIVIILALWVIAGPLTAALGDCLVMGPMCAGPCGVGPAAVDGGSWPEGLSTQD